MMIEPRIYNGLRDYAPERMILREEIMQRMREVFTRYGFQPLETPTMEYLEILLGKYGNEEKLIYKLDYKNDQARQRLALRYDLTVPLARFVALNRDLPLPFKRYQMQPVWRADRPQPRQGRYREFYQCDMDIVGVNDLSADAEIILLQQSLLSDLKIPGFRIRINHRRLLAGLVQQAGIGAELESPVLIALDKWEKIGRDGVARELSTAGVSVEQAERFLNRVDRPMDYDRLETLRDEFSDGAARTAVTELIDLFTLLPALGVNMDHVRFDLKLARGLGYYTGPIFETEIPELPHMGSLTGGGRYDGLVGMFAKEDQPAVGATMGLDRIITAMEQLDLLKSRRTRTRVLVTQYFPETREYGLALARQLRNAGIAVETWLGKGSLKKQFNYANKLGIPWVIVAGETEMTAGKYTLKQMEQGTQDTLTSAEILLRLQS